MLRSQNGRRTAGRPRAMWHRAPTGSSTGRTLHVSDPVSQRRAGRALAAEARADWYRLRRAAAEAGR